MNTIDDDILEAVKSFPPNDPYRKHFLEHLDWMEKRLVNPDPECRYCKTHEKYNHSVNLK